MKRKTFAILFFIFIYCLSFKVQAKDNDYDSKDLSDYFGAKQACTDDGSVDDCRNGNEYKFYLKMYDIYFLYKNKYNVKLDLPLIMATLYYNNEQLPTVFEENLNDYDRSAVKDTNQVTNLDWEYDYKNEPCYVYLNSEDNSYDMQILAKNMVTKKITYKCSDGSSNEAKDIETSNYSEETLKCTSGKYDENSVNATYELDTDKYNEFLLEYIKLKYHTKGNISKTCKGSSNTPSYASNDLASAFVNLALSEYDEQKNITGGEKYLKPLGFSYGTPWCASFVTYVQDNAKFNGQTVSDIVKVRSAAVSSFTDFFMQSTDSNIKFHYNSLCSNYSSYDSYTPKPGDYIFFTNSYLNCSGYSNTLPSGCQDHIGIVEKYENGVIYTIEGNTGSGYGWLDKKQYDSSKYCSVVGFGSWY